jgi:hypothetical protein
MSNVKIGNGNAAGMQGMNSEFQTIRPNAKIGIQNDKSTERNHLQKADSSPVSDELRTAMMRLVKNPPAEQGHGTQGPAGAQVDPAVKAREDAIAQNKQIEAQNAPIQKQLSELETKLNCLDKLLNHIDAKGDGVLTWAEVTHLAMNSGVPEVRDAANWLMRNKAVYDALPKRGTAMGGDGNVLGLGGTGAGRLESAQFLATLRGEVEGLRAQLKPLVEVPPLPGTQSSGQVGGGQNNPGQTTPINGSNQTPETPKPAGKSATENYDKIGAFSSKATTSEGRMADGLDFLQRGSQALQEDLLNASTENPPNQAKIALIQNKLQQVQNALTAVMQMMKQFQEMMSNMSKMYSEMAMSAIRNMR